MRVTDDGLEIDVLWGGGVNAEDAERAISPMDDGGKVLWETP